jgi:phage terminase small subunit
MGKEFSTKQKLFIESYSGNATEAARTAGYDGSDAVLAQIGHENMRKPEIVSEIKNRENKIVSNTIVTRVQRQEFWSSIMMDGSFDIYARIKASELLAKSEGDFIKKDESKSTVTLEQLVLASYKNEP